MENNNEIISKQVTVWDDIYLNWWETDFSNMVFTSETKNANNLQQE